MILVTGGTGLVGSHLLYKLATKNEKLRAIYRSKHKLDIVKRVFSYYTKEVDVLFNKIEWFEADILDVPQLTEAFTDISLVYHCAAFVSFEPNKYTLLRRTNIEGTANIVNIALKTGVTKLCYVSSVATLGESLNQDPIQETTYWNPEADNNVYAITKYGAEMEVWRATQEGLHAVIINPGVILGAGIWNHGTGTFFKQIHNGLKYYATGGTGFVDVEDVTSIMIALMQSDITNENFILVSENWSYKQLLDNIAKALQVKPPYKKVSSGLTQIAWRLDWLISKLTGKRRKLSKQMASTINNTSVYSNKKITKTLNYKWIPITQSINTISKRYLEDLSK
ncbi:NAD-dependent epimerase/dehydratase family protein [Formosa sp. A9]|uniref:NAD-dependent epimerase/dehydratase family protein n=1 Tax=Formosa sp. A9 TaxID=3442641 RepID=UPI003EB6BA01